MGQDSNPGLERMNLSPLTFLVNDMSLRFTATTIRKLFIACILEHILASALKTPVRCASERP